MISRKAGSLTTEKAYSKQVVLNLPKLRNRLLSLFHGNDKQLLTRPSPQGIHTPTNGE